MAGGWDCVSFPEGLAFAPLECDIDKPETCTMEEKMRKLGFS